MTTASVYYHPDSGYPEYILIDGERADVTHFDPDNDAVFLSAVDRACRSLNWRIMSHAPIVRQADGRGTVRIEPVPADPFRHGVAYVHQNSLGDGTGVTRISVAVDGKTSEGLALALLDSLDPGEDRAARDVVDGLLAGLNYVRSGPLVVNQNLGWTCTADPLPATVRSEPDADGFTDGSHSGDPHESQDYPTREWQDYPTLVRMDDTTAAALQDMSAKLNIPPDELACAWIRREAAGALLSYNRYTEPGYVMEGNKIGKWYDDGGCSIVRADTGERAS